MLLVSNVTAPFRAKARPSTVAPVDAVIDVRGGILARQPQAGHIQW